MVEGRAEERYRRRRGAGGELREDEKDDKTRRGERGVRVVEIAQNSQAFAAGLREGDLIISVNKQPVYGLKDVENAVGEGDTMMLLNVIRGNSGLFIVIR